MIVIAMIAILLAISLPSLIGSRMAANETAAIAGMRQITQAQELFRLRDMDQDGETDYAISLTELGPSTAGLIASSIADGESKGYQYYLDASVDQLVTFEAHADPTDPGQTGDRHFFVDPGGSVRFSTSGPAGPNDPTID